MSALIAGLSFALEVSCQAFSDSDVLHVSKWTTALCSFTHMQLMIQCFQLFSLQ